MSEKIDRKELIEMIQLLNNETVILEKIGMDAIKTSKTNTQRLTFKFRDMMHAIDGNKLLDDIPEVCWNFYHDNRDHLAIEKEKKEIVKTESEEVTEKIENNIKRKKVEKEKDKEKHVEKESKPKKSTKEKDKYGFGIGTKCSMIMALAEKGKYTCKQIMKELEGKSKINPNSVFSILDGKHPVYKGITRPFKVVFDEDKVVSIVKR